MLQFIKKLDFKNKSKNNILKQNWVFIEYCKTLGINIPQFSYYKHLLSTGNCRMCLIMNAKPCLANKETFYRFYCELYFYRMH